MSSAAKRRPLILAGTVAFVTVTGTFAGAYIKQDRQSQERKRLQKSAEVDTGQQIALLESTRGHLTGRKTELEKKIGELRERQRSKREREMEADLRKSKLGGPDGNTTSGGVER